MNIRIDMRESAAGGAELLADIGKYGSAAEWCAALLDGRTVYKPLWASVTWDGEARLLLNGGEDVPGARDVVKSMAALPLERLAMPGGRISVEADIAERVLEIDLDG